MTTAIRELNSNPSIDRLRNSITFDSPSDDMGNAVDNNSGLNSWHAWFRMFVVLGGVWNPASAQPPGTGIPAKSSPAWQVLLPIGDKSSLLPEESPLRSVREFKLHGPHPGHPFLLGEYETDGNWQVVEEELQRTGGANALLALSEAEQFDVEGIVSSDRLGGMLFLLGWDPENSGYVLYNVTMKDKESGSPWHLCRMEKGRFVRGEDREVARHEWAGIQSIRLSVREQQLTLSIGKSRVVQNLPLPRYSRGKIMLGTYNTRYGPKPLRIRSLRIREIPSLEAESSIATESSR